MYSNGGDTKIENCSIPSHAILCSRIYMNHVAEMYIIR